jgi:ParB-like nuclease domain
VASDPGVTFDKGQSPDILDTYARGSAAKAEQSEVDEMTKWATAGGDTEKPMDVLADEAPIAQGESFQSGLKDPFPTDQKPPAEQSTAGKVMRNIKEIPSSSAGGAREGIKSAITPITNAAFDWAGKHGVDVMPLADYVSKNTQWLQTVGENPQTPTGKIAKAASRFVVGYVPALKVMRVAGAAGKLGAVGAGALADVATSDTSEANLSDLWTEVGLPSNLLTDALRQDVNDSEMTARIKKAGEGMVAGEVLELAIKGVRAVRSTIHNKWYKDAKDAKVREAFGDTEEAAITRATGTNKKHPLVVDKSTIPAPAPAAPAAPAKAVPPPGSTNTTFRVKTDTAWKMKDVDRNVTPSSTDLPKLTADVTKNGVKTPITVTVHKESGLARVTDGNNRLAAARAAGQSDVPMKIKYTDVPFQEDEAAKAITIKELGFKPENLPVPPPKSAAAQSVDDWLNAQLGDKNSTPGAIADAKVALSDAELTAAKPTLKAPDPGVTAEDLLSGAYKPVKTGDTELHINFARMSSSEDIKSVMATMADKNKIHIDKARRGTVTEVETRKLAAQLGMTVEDLLNRRAGQAFNDAEIMAARQLYAASAERVFELAEAAGKVNAGDLDHYVLRKAMATHDAIGKEVLGAAAEAGRSLRAHRMMAGSGFSQAKMISKYMESVGGKEASAKMAKKLLLLKQEGNVQALNKFIEQSVGSRTFDAAREVWVNGLLSNPTTHVVNATSNTGVFFMVMSERAVASRISKITGTTDGVEIGEASAMAYGAMKAIHEAWQLTSIAFKTGEKSGLSGKMDDGFKPSFTAENLGVPPEGAIGKAVDFIGNVARVPGHLMDTADEFFKTIGYRAEVSAQAFRQAKKQGLSGKELAEEVRRLEMNPPEHMRIEGQNAAAYNTFQDEMGNIGKAMSNLRHNVPIVSFILPFVRTPVNIARFTFERTPLAPLVGQWRADIAAGGARADIAIARIATGTTISAAALSWADSGLISAKGPANAGEREAMQRQGWQEYSIKIGKNWYSYNRADPLGAMLGISANIAEKVKRAEINEDDVDEWQEVAAMVTAASGEAFVNKTYLRGIADVFRAIGDPDRYEPAYLKSLLSSFVPYSQLANAITRSADPVKRNTEDPLEAIQAKTGGGVAELGAAVGRAFNPWDSIEKRVDELGDKLPAALTLWGKESRSESNVGMDYNVSPEAQTAITKGYDFLTPFTTREVKPSSIDTEIMRLAPLALRDNVAGSPPERIKKKSAFMGVQVNFKQHPKVYEEYTRLAGSKLKDQASGLGCEDFLNAVVQDDHPLSTMYKDLPDVLKIKFINSTVTRYRKMAAAELMNEEKYPEFGDFRQMVQEIRDFKQNSKMPEQ